MAVDTDGNLFVADANVGSIFQLQVAGANFFTQAVASTSPSQTLTFVFDTGGTLGSYQVLTQGTVGLDFVDAGGGTCAPGTTYSAGAACTVNVAFTPRFPGLRQGAVTLKNNSGTVIATAYLQGVGTGSQVGFTPGTLSTVAGDGTQCASNTQATPSLSVAPLSITYGAAVAGLTATLTYGGAAAPTGLVTFAVDGGTPLTGTCAGSSSPLLCSVSDPLSSLTAGTHTVTVALAADANYTAVSRSGAVLTVTQATPVVTWPTPARPSAMGRR